MGKITDETDRADGHWIRRAKAWSVAAGGLATLVVALSAHLKPETVARETAGAAATEVRRLDKALEATQNACKRTARQAVARARAESDSARTLLLGYLLAQRGAPERRQIGDAISGVVKQLGASKVQNLKPLISPPAPIKKPNSPTKLEKLSKGSEQ